MDPRGPLSDGQHEARQPHLDLAGPGKLGPFFMLLDYNPLTGETVTFEANADGSFTIGQHQDVSPVLELNKRQALENDAHAQVRKGWLKYASVPNVLIVKWKQELGIDFFDENHWPKVMALINSPEYRFLKTTELVHDR